jgi:hypothetical protein
MAAPTLTFAEKERPVEQTMTPEEQYGVIKAPDSPLMAKAAMMFRDIERRVEGCPAAALLPFWSVRLTEKILLFLSMAWLL